MRRPAIMIAATCLTLTLAAPTLMAMCLPSSLEQKVGLSDLIFVGTVSGYAQSGHIQRTSGRNPTPPTTRYVFAHIRYIKAPANQSLTADTLTMVQPGGPGLWVEDQPTFETGKRYVVLAIRDTFFLPPPYPFHYTALGCAYPYPMLIAPGDTTEAQLADTLRAVVDRAGTQSAPPK